MTDRETKTVELPLTKSEQRRLENIQRRDQKRRRTTERLESVAERDQKIAAINEKYAPKIMKLQQDRNTELKKVWDEWREKRSTA